jgi:hypothetical protein
MSQPEHLVDKRSYLKIPNGSEYLKGVPHPEVLWNKTKNLEALSQSTQVVENCSILLNNM